MPFTPFHVGPSATVAFPLKRIIDIPVFIIANVAIDLEPLTVMIFTPSYPLHGYAHSFLGAGLIGALWGMIAFRGKGILRDVMRALGLQYETSMTKAIIAGVLGALIHVLLDAPIYTDIRPFYPLDINPFYGLASQRAMYFFCSILFIPAILFYSKGRTNRSK